MSKKLVINADDLGYCQRRNDGILACFKAGAISSASLLVNGAAAADGARQAKDAGLPVGLHMNLTEGRPISAKTLHSILTDTAGYFLGKGGFTDKFSMKTIKQMDPSDVDVIQNEMEAQIELFLQLYGALPIHVDGHQHFHVVPGIDVIFAQALKKYSVKWTRVPHDAIIDDCDWLPEDAHSAFLRQKSNDASAAGDVFSNHDVRFPKFVGLCTMGSNMTRARLQMQLTTAFSSQGLAQVSSLPPPSHLRPNLLNDDGELPHESVPFKADCACVSANESGCEIMVHPGYVNVDNDGGCGSGPDSFSKSTDREHEIQVLCSKEMLNFYQEQSIMLCSYQDLETTSL